MKLGKKLQIELIKQMNREANASYTYLAMSVYVEEQALTGIGSWMRHQSKEEQSHMMKYYHYILNRNGYLEFEALKKPSIAYKSVKEMFEVALQHEEYVTKTTHQLLELAQQEKDHATVHFLQWFVEEQVEEECQVNEILTKLDLLGKDNHALYLIDKELGNKSA